MGAETMTSFWELCRNISKNERMIQSIFIIAGIALFGYVLSSITLVDIYKTFSMMGANFLLIILILFFEVVVSSARMGLLIGKNYDIPIKKTFDIMFETTLFAVYSPGKVGELMKLDLFKKEGVKRTYSFAAIVVGRAFDLVVVMMLSFGVLFTVGVDFVLITMLGVLGLIAAFVIYRLGIFKEVICNIMDAFETFFDLKTLTLVAALSIVLWVADASMPYITLRVLGYDVDFFQTSSVYFTSIIVGLVSMIPGGLGASEFSFSYMMNHLLGVAEADAVSAIVVLRVITFVVFSIGSLLYFMNAKNALVGGRPARRIRRK